MGFLPSSPGEKAIETGGNVIMNFFNGKNDVKKHKLSCDADVQKRKIEAVETDFLGTIICGTIAFLGSMIFSKDEVEVGVKKGDKSVNMRGRNKY